MAKGEKILNIVLFVILVIFFIEAQKIPAGFMVESVQREVGADFWPKALLLLLLILTGALIIKSFFFTKIKEQNKTIESDVKDRWANWLMLMVSIIIYIKIQYIIGFILTSYLLVGFNLYNFGCRKKTTLIILPLGATFLFVLTFGRLLAVPLPKGISIFRLLGLLFY